MWKLSLAITILVILALAFLALAKSWLARGPVKLSKGPSRLLLAKAQPSESTQIPRQIFMTTRKKSEIPEKVKENWTYFLEDIPLVIFDDEEAATFVEQHFTEQVVRAYRKLKGAHRADLFRYCVLYQYGGLYLDIKSKLTQPIGSFINFHSMENRLYTALSTTPGTIYQGIIATPPGSAIMLRAIQAIVRTPKLAPKFHYHVFTTQLYRILLDETNGPLKPGENELRNGGKLILFSEICQPLCSTPDRYGKCCKLELFGKPVMDVRWPDYPWR